jgi:hypothetical protein
MNVKLFINDVSITPLKVKLKKEGERSIDQIDISLPHNVSVSSNQELLYLQDMASLDKISGFYNFQGNVKDESGNKNHGTGANITYVDGQWNSKHASFNGTSSIISMPNADEFDFDGKFDILIWAKWSSTAQQYLLTKRSSSSNGLSISVNGTTAGDITVDIGGTALTSSTAGYNDGDNHLIRLSRDADNLVTLYVDNVSKGTSTISYDTTDNNLLIIGRDHTTGYYAGEIGRVRIYKGGNITDQEHTNIFTKRNSRSTLKFGGYVTKIENKTTHNTLLAQSFGKILAETEVRDEAYDNKSPEYIVEDLISNNTNMIPIMNGGATGLTLTKFTATGKLIDIIKDFASLTNRMFYTTGNNEFVFEPVKFVTTDITFTHGVISKILETGYDDTELVNDLTILGENIRYRTIELLSGDGNATSFDLNHGAVSTMVKIGGVEKLPEIDYSFDSVGKTIKFESPPASGSGNIEVDYTYEQPLFIQAKRQSSIDQYGIRAKRLNLRWINNRADGVRFVQSYLNRYKDISQKVKVEIGNMYNSIVENDIIRVVNTHSSIDDEYVVKSVEWTYPEFNTVLNVGEYYFDYFEYDKEIIKKLHDIEGSLTTIKALRDYESLEETITVNDIVIQIITENFTESLNMGVTPVIYDKNDNNYGSGTYGSRVTGSVYVSE